MTCSPSLPNPAFERMRRHAASLSAHVSAARRSTDPLGVMRSFAKAVVLIAAIFISMSRHLHAAEDEQAVIVRLKMPNAEINIRRFFELEDAVANAIGRSGAGEYDGNEIGQGEFVMYCYGPKADTLYSAIEPTLARSRLSTGATVIIRYGKPGAKQREVRL